MERLRNSDYLAELGKRASKSRAYAKHQLVGLEIADMLDDREHKSLYIKLAKQFDSGELLRIAKSVVEKKGIANLGAYFMKVLANQKQKS